MSTNPIKSGFVKSGSAKIYYEISGRGIPFIMIHAGVADCRQWNNEFAFFSQTNQVLRYDLRGYGKSEPADGDFSHLGDLVHLLDAVQIEAPFVLMGCSMGGGLAMDFALAYPAKVKALIMVDSGPSGLKLDVPTLPKYAEAEKAFDAGDLDLVAEIETQIWFDGVGRSPAQVNPAMRSLLYKMNRLALSHEAMQRGKRLPNSENQAVDHLDELQIPVLIIVGSHDTPYSLAAADYMIENLKFARKAMIEDAAHLPNMDQPKEFRRIVQDFLKSLPG